MDMHPVHLHCHRRLFPGRQPIALENYARRLLGLPRLRPLIAGEVIFPQKIENPSLEPTSLLGAITVLPLPELNPSYYPRGRSIERRTKTLTLLAHTDGKDELGGFKITSKGAPVQTSSQNKWVRMLNFLRLKQKCIPSTTPPKLTLSARRGSDATSGSYKAHLNARGSNAEISLVPGDFTRVSVRSPVAGTMLSTFLHLESPKKHSAVRSSIRGELAVRVGKMHGAIRTCSKSGISASGGVKRFSLRVGRTEKAVVLGPLEVRTDEDGIGLGVESKFGYTTVSNSSFAHSFRKVDVFTADMRVARKLSLSARLTGEGRDLNVNVEDSVTLAATKERPGFRMLSEITLPRTGLRRGESKMWAAAFRLGWFF